MSDAAENLLEQEKTEMNQLVEVKSNPVSASTSSLILDGDSLDKMMKLADMMAQAVVQVPDHLRGKPSDCLAIIMQAMQWKMNPYAVAQKTHIVSGKLGYEAQLVNAVVQNSGAIEGSFEYEFKGEGNALSCRVGAVRRGQKSITWNEWYSISEVKVMNSPLWKTNPKQQLGYLQLKNWARLYAPGAILGVYTREELEDYEEEIRERDITPQTKDDLDSYPQDEFDKNLPTWEKYLNAGKLTVKDLKVKAETKGRFTTAQLAELNKLEVIAKTALAQKQNQTDNGDNNENA